MRVLIKYIIGSSWFVFVSGIQTVFVGLPVCILKIPSRGFWNCLWFWVFYYCFPLLLGNGHCCRGLCIFSSYIWWRLMSHWGLGLWHVSRWVWDCWLWRHKLLLLKIFFKASFFHCFTSPYYFVAIKISHQDRWFRELFY